MESHKELKNEITLFHVSTNLLHDGVFNPQIPSDIEEDDGEDFTIPRICLSSDLLGCFGSMPDGGRGLGERIDRYGNKFKVYEFKLNANDPMLRTPEQVQQYVPDALLHSEYWYLNSLVPFDAYCIEVDFFQSFNNSDKIDLLGFHKEVG